MKNILILLLLPLCIWANKPEYAAHLISEELKKDANAVIRRNVIEFDVRTPGKAHFKQQMAVTRLNSKAAYDDLYINYSNYIKIDHLEINVYDASGKLIRKVKKNEIEDISASGNSTIAQDYRLKYLDLSYGNYPYTIEYKYEKTYSEIIFYPDWSVQRFRTAVEFSQYTLKTPSDIEVQYKLHNLDITPSKKTVQDKTTQVFQVKNLTAVVPEYHMPESKKRLALGLFAPSKFEIEGYEGDMTSWESIGRFFYELNRGRDQLSQAMVAEVKTLTREAKTDKEKIDILYRYIQENMRYVSIQLGIGGWQAFNAQYVEQNKFGDCKALSNFMKAMLRVVNIDAYLAVVYAGRTVPYDVSPDFALPMFNHMILHVPSSDYWLECTSSDSPPNYLGTFTTDRNVLLLTEEGGKLVRTPKYTAETNFEHHHTYIQVDEKGQAQVQDSIEFGGLDYDYYQSFMVSHKGKAEQQKQYLEDSDLPQSELTNLNIELQKDKAIGRLQSDINVPRYASRSGKRLFVPVNLNNLYTVIPDANNARINPVLLRNSYIERDTILIQLPTTARIESLPKAVNLTSDYGSYQLELEANGTEVRCIRYLKVLGQEIPAEQYNDWRDFCKKIARKDKAKIVAVMD